MYASRKKIKKIKKYKKKLKFTLCFILRKHLKNIIKKSENESLDNTVSFKTIKEMLIISGFFLRSFFSTLWTNKLIASNNRCINILSNKLFNTSHMQMRQHSTNLIYKTLYQYKSEIFTYPLSSIND